MEITTVSPAQTRQIGESVAKKILKKNLTKQSLIICLRGDLGSGKTTFLQGFARGLGITEKILSPTFILFKKFEIVQSLPNKKEKSSFKYFYHLDCYRIEGIKEILEIGWLDQIVFNPENIVAIEWPQKIKEVLPKKHLSVKFLFKNKKERKIKISL